MSSDLTETGNDNAWRNDQLGMVPKLEFVLNNKMFCDVAFQIPGENGFEIVKAHKFMLTVASPVFEAMFTGPFVENGQNSDKPIDLVDVDLLGFRTMLNFIYGGELAKDLAPSNLLMTMCVANKYCISDLVQQCSQRLDKLITTDTVVNIMQLAQLCGDTKLEEKSFKYLLRNFATALETPEFLHCSREILIQVLKEDTIRVKDEITLFQTMLRWSTAECERRNMDVASKNQREVLGEIINLIRFPTMSVDDLYFKVIPFNILTLDESTLLLQHMTMSQNKKIYLAPLPFISMPRMDFQNVVYKLKWKNLVLPISGSIKKEFRSFGFTVDRRIALVGCGFYGPTGNSSKLQVEMKVVKIVSAEPTAAEKGVLVQQSTIKTKFAKKNQIFDIDFNSLVVIEPGIKHYIQYKMMVAGLLLLFLLGLLVVLFPLD